MNIEQIARECGLYDDDQEPLTEYLQQFANAILEEAAKECFKAYLNYASENDATDIIYDKACVDCAEAIRRMKV